MNWWEYPDARAADQNVDLPPTAKRFSPMEVMLPPEPANASYRLPADDLLSEFRSALLAQLGRVSVYILTRGEVSLGA
jgi:hypothetical protein